LAIVSTALLTAVLSPFRDDLGLLNVGLLFLLLTLVIAAVWGRDVGLFAALVTNLALNFFFIDPLYKFTVQEPRNVLALVVFLVVSVIGGSLLSAALTAAETARRRQAETQVALNLSRALSAETEPQDALRTLCEQVVTAFSSPGAAVLSEVAGGWQVVASSGEGSAARLPDQEERALLGHASAQGTYHAAGTTGFDRRRPRRLVRPQSGGPGGRARTVAFVPLQVGGRVLGVLRVDGPIGETPFSEDPTDLLNAIASEAALALHRVELAKEAAHAQALREADEMKTALMASISHDLKTPLAGIKAAITSVLDKNIRWSEEDIDAFHRTVNSQADRLDRVISDILDLNRIESGSLTPEIVPVRLSELFARVRDLTSNEARGREISIDAPGGLEVLADEALLVQALVNLVENAIKYSKAGGAIHLAAVRLDTEVALSVTDEGPGIAPQDLPFVFERFYRAEEHSRRVKGSGLGLSIVKGFVTLSGGTVSVESSPRGTCFTIKLPAVSSSAVKA
jgi:two-component system sensor histidine kinase KdpD